MSLKRTVAALLLCTSLATPAAAQNTDLPDVSIVATAPRVDLNAPPPDPVRNAIIATQDINFFERYPAPSTLTQQIASTYTLPTNRTLTNKVAELAFALNLSSTFTADEILTIYSQTIYLGARCFGFADALNHRMGIDIEDATLRDTLTLAALIAHPVLGEYDPDRFVTRFGFAAGIGADVGLWDDDMKTAISSSGNAAFDTYKAETLHRLEEQQGNFEAFLKRLRDAKDKAEFDDFMDERATRSTDDADDSDAKPA